ncbi:glycoside hydrolase [Sphingomonas lacunae]|uniref:Glycoside hydrolase n=1 Tax=Sphingomonas lacunae TaxID=2698828 RepID=A0A6M4AY02_9SPHN|nr:GH25 family lysozyme [Sphingomonas lacunae]QJQ33240.1 glycoside hydrolase [Sphingomonas lacunae]
MSAAISPVRRWMIRLVLLMLLAGAVVIGWKVWANGWRPDRSEWPMQGVAIGPENAPVSWPSLASQGANFAYIDATDGTGRANSAFTREQAAARASGFRVGAIHHFGLCTLASQQADGFVRLVPRDRDALPTAIILDLDEACPRKPTRALLLTELSTFLNQLETHMGKAAIIAPDRAFESEYSVSEAINRPLWLRSNRAEPATEGPDWIIWQANDTLKVAGSTGPTRWLVLNEGRHVAGDAGEGE